MYRARDASLVSNAIVVRAASTIPSPLFAEIGLSTLSKGGCRPASRSIETIDIHRQQSHVDARIDPLCVGIRASCTQRHE